MRQFELAKRLLFPEPACCT